MLIATRIGCSSAICWALLIVTWPHGASAEGALAVGMSGDIAKDGYSLGIVTNRETETEAREGALDWCRNHGSPVTRANCAIISTFHRQCAAEALDPKAGTPGAGWAVALEKETAEKTAMANCRATAGRDRQNFCEVATSLCDTKP